MRRSIKSIMNQKLLRTIIYNYSNNTLKGCLSLLFTLLFAYSSFAQDGNKSKQVNITSTFKPSLKEAAKINFNAAAPVTDTSRPALKYNIPDGNLLFNFQPGTLRPLALQPDTLGKWSNESYVKLGYGNLKTPYVQTGISLGSNTAGLNIYARHVSSQGKILNQDYSNTNVDLNAFFQSSKNLEWDARLGSVQEKHNKYGYQPKTLNFPDDSIAVKYQTWRGRLSFHNINPTEFGLNYSPEIKIDVFNDQLSNSESNTYLYLPLEKAISKEFVIDLSLTGNLSRYSPLAKSGIANNYLEIAPSVIYKNPNVSLQAGIRPGWDNSFFVLFPNLLAELSSTDKKFAFQLGWTGYIRNSGFEYLAGFNPWIWAPQTVFNTRIQEAFAGFKGAVGDHFSYGAKMSYNQLDNQPLFINDTLSGKSFMVLKEDQVKVINLGGEMGYSDGEKFSMISNLTVNQYKTKVNSKAWGLLPLEFKTDISYELLKDLYVKSTLYAFDGPWSLSKAGAKKLPGAVDLSAGLEFKVVKNVKLWAQFNNIFNKEYQRWNQYPVYGFNLMGGVVFSFAQRN